MSEKRRGLGRGLGALIPTGPGGIHAVRGDGVPGSAGRSPEPVDVFFADRDAASTAGAGGVSRPSDGAGPGVADAREADGAADTSSADTSSADASGAADVSGAAETSGGAGTSSTASAAEPGDVRKTAELDRAADNTDLGIDDADLGSDDRDLGSDDAGLSTDDEDHNWTVGARGVGGTIDIRRSGTDGAAEQIADPAITGAYFQELPVAAIAPNPRQPRQVFDQEAMSELAASITEVGLLQPIVVRALDAGRFELVMGERRWRAAQLAGLAVIPAIVRSTGDDAMLRDALLENLHRSQLNALEEAAAYDQLLEDFGCTHDELATRLGRSRPQISNTLRLLRLPPAVQRRVAAGVLSAGHARALLGLEDGGEQERLAQRIVAEGLSVRSVEEIVAVGGLTPAVRARTRRPHAPGLEDLASRLSDRFDTRVKVDLGRRKGRITVDFASVADLHRIVELLAPDLSARAPVPLAAQSWQRLTPGA